MLLVDADDAEPRQRREHRRARADDDRRLAGDDPLALVAPLGVGQRRVEDGDAVAEALAEAAERLRREGDLRDEDDRAEPTLERRGAGPEVDLGLAAPGRAGEQEVAAVAVERAHDALECPLLGLGQPRRPRLGREPDVRLPPLTAPRAQLRRDELERARRRRAVVVGDPERELDERRRQPYRTRSTGATVTPGGASTPVSTTTPRCAARPKRTATTAPFPTSSATSYVNGRATERDDTSG